MNAALFSTIWIALTLFVVAEAGKRRQSAHRAAPAWAWAAWAIGAILCAVHIVLAFAGRYGWSRDAAVRETARQTAAVYGVNWGGGVYVNYVFIAVWLIEACWWRAFPARYVGRQPAITWCLRAFYLLIIVNAAVVFAGARGRAIGLVLVAALVWVWRPRRSASS